MPKYIVITLLAIGLSACASSGSSTDTGSETAKKSEVTKAKRDCQIVKTTDSRLGKKVCSD